ncbi:MAG TPA: D-alanine--D-alanine ligase A, partial [Armatimonadota bacterium]
MDRKIRVGVIFGGKSAEHEVSLQSAQSIIRALNPDRYEVVLIGIDKAGRWALCDESQYLLHADDPDRIQLQASP